MYTVIPLPPRLWPGLPGAVRRPHSWPPSDRELPQYAPEHLSGFGPRDLVNNFDGGDSLVGGELGIHLVQDVARPRLAVEHDVGVGDLLVVLDLFGDDCTIGDCLVLAEDALELGGRDGMTVALMTSFERST